MALEREVSPAAPRRRNLSGLWIAASAMTLIGLILLFVGLTSAGVIHIGPPPALRGTVLDTPYPAPDFQLKDQFNNPVALSSYHGKVVVLTFLYTNCPDTCPLITAKLHQSVLSLGAESQKVGIIAVSVDPARDTLAVVRSYSEQKDMLQRWHYLIGASNDLSPVWKSYGIAAVTSGNTVTHSTPTYVIDQGGQVREILDSDFAADDLVHDIHALLNGA